MGCWRTFWARDGELAGEQEFQTVQVAGARDVDVEGGGGRALADEVEFGHFLPRARSVLFFAKS